MQPYVELTRQILRNKLSNPQHPIRLINRDPLFQDNSGNKPEIGNETEIMSTTRNMKNKILLIYPPTSKSNGVNRIKLIRSRHHLAKAAQNQFVIQISLTWEA